MTRPSTPRPEHAPLHVSGDPHPPAASDGEIPASTRRARVLRGTAWTLGAFALGILLRFGTNVLLSHLLFPAAFAMLALAGILTQGLKMFSDIGITQSIVRSPRGNDPLFLDTAWTLQILRGLVLFLTACVLTWPLAAAYRDDRLLWILPVSGLTLIIGGFGSTAQATLGRELRLGRLTLMELGERIVQTLITAVWAVLSPTVWAILAGTLGSRMLYVAGTHLLLGGRRNRFAWDREALRELLHFGKWIFLSTAITFFAMQADRMLLGRVSTLEVLGVYSIALTLAGVPLELGSRLAAAVLYPALSSVARTHRSSLPDRVHRARSVVLSGGLFATLGVVLAGPWFFLQLYDSRYADAAWMTQIASGCLWISLLQSSADRALLAVGDSRSLALSNGANLLGTLCFSLLGYSTFGVPGFMVGVGLGNLAGHLVVQFAMNLHGLSIRKQDLAYSGALALLVLADMGARLLVRTVRPGFSEWACALAVTLPLLGAVGAWTALRVSRRAFR